MLKTGDNKKSSRLVHYILALYKNLKSSGVWVGKSAMAEATKTTACPISHMTYTQAPGAREKKIFHLLVFHFTHPVKNYSFSFWLTFGNVL